MRTVANRVEKSTWHLLPEMAQQQQCQRVNLVELKAQFEKKIGPEKTSKYFEQFKKYLEGKLVKIKFDELCCLTIGKENIRLHNHLIKSIVKNALLNKIPSSGPINGVVRKAKTNSPLHENGDFLCSSNGDGHAAFGGSHRKIRSDRRTRYSLSVNSPRPDDSAAPLQGVVVKKDIVLANGDLKSPDLARPLPLCSARVGSPHLPEAEFNPNSKRQRPEAEINPSVKRQRLEVLKSSAVQVLTDDEVAIEAADVENDKAVAVGEVNELESAVWVDRPLTAPLGIQFCPGTIGYARRPTYTGLNHDSTYCIDSQQLPDTETLCRRMEKAAKAEDLQNVNLGCAIISNYGVDALLKRLIKSAIELKKGGLAGQSQEPYSQIPGQSTQGVNISRAAHPLHMDNTRIGKDAMQKESFDQSSVSLLDFKTAMDLYPQQLGEHWPSKLEKNATGCTSNAKSLPIFCFMIHLLRGLRMNYVNAVGWASYAKSGPIFCITSHLLRGVSVMERKYIFVVMNFVLPNSAHACVWYVRFLEPFMIHINFICKRNCFIKVIDLLLFCIQSYLVLLL